MNEGICIFVASHHLLRWPGKAPLGGSSKWLVTMVIASRPLNGVLGTLINSLYKWLINGGDPNYLLNGMILQVTPYHEIRPYDQGVLVSY